MIPSVNRQKWLLLFGDVALIALATYLSPFIRLGQAIQIFDLHTGASVFTLILYIVMIYIFSLESYPFPPKALLSKNGSHFSSFPLIVSNKRHRYRHQIWIH